MPLPPRLVRGGAHSAAPAIGSPRAGNPLSRSGCPRLLVRRRPSLPSVAGSSSPASLLCRSAVAPGEGRFPASRLRVHVRGRRRAICRLRFALRRARQRSPHRGAAAPKARRGAIGGDLTNAARGIGIDAQAKTGTEKPAGQVWTTATSYASNGARCARLQAVTGHNLKGDCGPHRAGSAPRCSAPLPVCRRGCTPNPAKFKNERTPDAR